MHPEQPTAYTVLGVEERATDLVLKSAYRALIRSTHPDLHPGPEAEARSKLLNWAYGILGNPARRKQYDVWLARQRQPAPVVVQRVSHGQMFAVQWVINRTSATSTGNMFVSIQQWL